MEILISVAFVVIMIIIPGAQFHYHLWYSDEESFCLSVKELEKEMKLNRLGIILYRILSLGTYFYITICHLFFNIFDYAYKLALKIFTKGN